MIKKMRVLFDIAHPAHVHFYRHMAAELSQQGHQWRIASREKDVTNALLDEFALPYVSASSARSGFLGLASELVERDRALVHLAREFEPDLILTRNPSGTHAGKVLDIPTVFDTDNARSAGIHYWAAAPFASVITTPDCFNADLGRRQVRYPSYKPLAFLHPNRFTPDESVMARLGLRSDERHFVVRLVSMEASHDRGEAGLAIDDAVTIVETLKTKGRVFLSSEGTLPSGLAAHKLAVRPSDFHNVLATASLCVGDSGSVAQESALLGVPAIFVSSFAGRTAPIEELEHRYGMVRSFTPEQRKSLFHQLENWIPREPDDLLECRSRILNEKVDLTSWYVDFLKGVALK